MHILEQLAWQSLPEDRIVSKLAAKCRAEHLEWTRGDKGSIRKIIADSCPPRGQKKRRLEAVIAEIERQQHIARRRWSNKPVDWERARVCGKGTIGNYGVSEARRDHILKERAPDGKHFSSCSAFTRQDDARAFLCKRSFRSYLYVVMDDGRRLVAQIKHAAPTRSFSAFLLDASGDRLKEAFYKGWSVQAEFKRLRTVLTPPSGDPIVLKWDSLIADATELAAGEKFEG